MSKVYLSELYFYLSWTIDKFWRTLYKEKPPHFSEQTPQLIKYLVRIASQKSYRKK